MSSVRHLPPLDLLLALEVLNTLSIPDLDFLIFPGVCMSGIKEPTSGCTPGLPVHSTGSSSGEKSYSKLISEQISVLVTVKEVTLEAEVPSNPNLDHCRNVMFLGMILPSPCIYPFSFYLPIVYYSVHQALLGNYYLPGIIPCSQESPRRAHKLWTMFNFPFRLQPGSMDPGVCSVNICSWGDNEGTTRDWHENATGLSE